jgi:hypothetical protein
LDAPGVDVPGLALEADGDGVVLSSLRRRAEWLEVRLVNESAEPRSVTIRLPIEAAREVDLLGRPEASLAVQNDHVRADMGPSEIRTMQMRRSTTTGASNRADTPARVTALQR